MAVPPLWARRERKRHDWFEHPNIWDEVNSLIEDCPWFKVYDIAEGLYDTVVKYRPEHAELFRDRLNQFFIEHGIGWELNDGEITYRGSEIFNEATTEAVEVLSESGRSVAANEIHEAIQDISRRPKPDVTGAIQHVFAALEATARDVLGEPKPTLGKLLPRLNLPPPLDSAVEKLWGYASERARHGREGQEVSAEEAELVVSVACAVCTFLSRRDWGDK